jgi:VCBS repeat protein
VNHEGETSSTSQDRKSGRCCLWVSLFFFAFFLLMFGTVCYQIGIIDPRRLPYEDRVLVITTRTLPDSAEDLATINSVIEIHSQEEEVEGSLQDVEHRIMEVTYRADINADGVEDSIVGASIHLSGQGRQPRFMPSGVVSVGFDDVDGDCFIDAWCCDPGDMTMRIFYGKEDGGFSSRQYLPSAPSYGGGAFHDVDKDGDLDIILRSIGESGAERVYEWVELERAKPN